MNLQDPAIYNPRAGVQLEVSNSPKLKEMMNSSREKHYCVLQRRLLSSIRRTRTGPPWVCKKCLVSLRTRMDEQQYAMSVVTSPLQQLLALAGEHIIIELSVPLPVRECVVSHNVGEADKPRTIQVYQKLVSQ